MKLKDVIVMIADGEEDRNGKSYLMENIVVPREPVVLTVEFDRSRIVGSARLKKVGDRVSAELFFFRAGEVSNPDVLLERVPAAGGILRAGRLELTEVAICTANADARVPRFSNYIARKEYPNAAQSSS